MSERARGGDLGEPDELCGFEKYRTPPGASTDPVEDCGDGVGGGALMGRGCFTRRDFAALRRGARPAPRNETPGHESLQGGIHREHGHPRGSSRRHRGVDPRRRAAPPTHEFSFGVGQSRAASRPSGPRRTRASSIFEALRRRERPSRRAARGCSLRLFGGWDLPAGPVQLQPDTGEPQWLRDSACRWVRTSPPWPLPSSPASSRSGTPTFVSRPPSPIPGRPGHPGGLLQRLQIIKVTSDESRATRSSASWTSRVGRTTRGSMRGTCEPRGAGAASRSALSVVGIPPSTRSERAAYYARVGGEPELPGLHAGLPEPRGRRASPRPARTSRSGVWHRSAPGPLRSGTRPPREANEPAAQPFLLQ